MYVAIVAMSHQNGLESAHGCNEWNTCYEEKITGKSKTSIANKKVVTPTILKDVQKQNIQRLSTGFEELDRVLRRRFSKRLFNSPTVENQE